MRNQSSSGRDLHAVRRFLSAKRLFPGIFSETRASQIAEFAVSLPLLVVFVVGIFDFTGAVSLKQKLTNAARDAARTAAADPANDLINTGVPPVSVVDAFWVVDNYLVSEKINDCGLSAIRPSSTGNLTWVSTATSCPGGASNALILTINRGCWTVQGGGATAVDVINTCVTIRYPYTWKFASLAGLFGGSFNQASYITTTAVAFNEN